MEVTEVIDKVTGLTWYVWYDDGVKFSLRHPDKDIFIFP